MKPIDTLKAGVAGIAEKVRGENPKLLQEAMKLVQSTPGGVSEFVKSFLDGGITQVGSSLSGSSLKQFLTPEKIAQVLGSEKISSLASSTGLDPKIVPEKLMSILPKVVDRLSPSEKLAGVK